MTALNARGHDFDIELEARALDSAGDPLDRTSEINATQLSVRLTAIAEDEAAGASASNGLPYWRELSQGRTRVADGFFTADRCYLMLASASPSTRPLERRRLEILQAVLRGAPQKCIAIEQRLAPSTIALHAKLALELLGVLDRPSRTHPLLMRIARSTGKPGEARCSTLRVDGDRAFAVVSMPRPE